MELLAVAHLAQDVFKEGLEWHVDVQVFMAWVIALAMTAVMAIGLTAIVVLGCMSFVAAVVEWVDKRRKRARK